MALQKTGSLQERHNDESECLLTFVYARGVLGGVFSATENGDAWSLNDPGGSQGEARKTETRSI